MKQLLTIILFLFLNLPVYSQDAVRTVTAVRSAPPKIDGIISENEWSGGGKVSGFIQTEPEEGKPASEKTEGWFLYDDHYLYLGFICCDSEPDKIMSELTGRDNLGTADIIELIIDTFHDHRNAYSFIATPAGSKIDVRYSEDGRKADLSWDGFWELETAINENGWTAEFKIPFSTIKFDRNRSARWGMNINRWIQRKNETVFWQRQTRNDIFKISKSGHLDGLVGIDPGMNLEVLPYLTSRARDTRTTSFQAENDNGITGVDIKYGITSNLTGTATINPDFAQIEADEDLINLTRYPLYLPEKRAFFTEGASIFNTAGKIYLGGGLFYSRRINEPVYGLKINGKAGNWDVGIMHALNDNDAGLGGRISGGTVSADTKTRAFYNIVRMSRDIFSHSQAGLIAMSKEFDGGHNRIFGIDGIFRLTDAYSFTYELAKSFTGAQKDKNQSVNLQFTRESDLLSMTAEYIEQAPDFAGNDLGFFSYNNFRRGKAWLDIAPRPEKIGIRQLRFLCILMRENYWNTGFLDQSSLSKNWGTQLIFTFMNYWSLQLGRDYGRSYDRIDNYLYKRKSYTVNLSNFRNSRVYFNIIHNQGIYRNGYSWSYNNYVRFRPYDRLQTEFSYNTSLAKLIDHRTNAWERQEYEVWRTKLYYHFNKDLHARVIFQYSGMEDRLDTYYLLAYNFRQKSFLYLAYTEQFDKAAYLAADGNMIRPDFSSSDKILQLKFSYLFIK